MRRRREVRRRSLMEEDAGTDGEGVSGHEDLDEKND